MTQPSSPPTAADGKCFGFSFWSPQADCLWRNSLKVPRATRPSSDCFSRIREPLVSSEDRDIDGHMHTLRNAAYTHTRTHTHLASCCSADHHPALSTVLLILPTLHVLLFTLMDTPHMTVWLFLCGPWWCAYSWRLLPQMLFWSSSAMECFLKPPIFHKWSAISIFKLTVMCS